MSKFNSHLFAAIAGAFVVLSATHKQAAPGVFALGVVVAIVLAVKTALSY